MSDAAKVVSFGDVVGTEKEPGTCNGRRKGHETTAKLHRCPYRYDIHDDGAPYCFCCEGCEQQCAEDV